MQNGLQRSLCLMCACLFSLLMSADNEKNTWPDLPLLQIETVGGEMPQNNIVYPPEGCVGISTKNRYVNGRMVMTLRGDTLYDSGKYVSGTSGMRIKIRGNSTGANLPQHPYKLKLSQKADLLMRADSRFQHKDWVLLSICTWNPAFTNNQTNISTWLGNMVSHAVGMHWTPATELVNVVLNGEYQGFYTLTESVADGTGRLDVDKTGFIVEHDAYYWNEDGIYFKSDYQHDLFGWTYKYPDADEVMPEQQENISSYINLLETKLYAGEEVDDYIDYPSFAKWVLAHDILGAYDAGGTNRFLCKRDYLLENPKASRLEMCALWDFDSSFRQETNKYSVIHETDYFYYPALFRLPRFRDTYLALYDSLVNNNFYEQICAELSFFEQRYSVAFEESAALHRTIFPGECGNPMSVQVAEMKNKLSERWTALAKNVEALRETIDGVGQMQRVDEAVPIYDVNGRCFAPEALPKLPPGVYIQRDAWGRTRKFYQK